MHDSLQTALLVGGASAAATVAFFGAITVIVRDSLFPRTSTNNAESGDYATAYFGRVQ